MASMSSREFTKATTYDKLQHRLGEWWDVMRELRPDSPAETWDKWASYLSSDCRLHLSGMGHHEARGREDAKEHMKRIVEHWVLKERVVLNSGMDFATGTTLMVNMRNRLEILGEEIDFAEAEVVEFDEGGKIVDYKLYCDPAPIMAIVNKKAKSH